MEILYMQKLNYWCEINDWKNAKIEIDTIVEKENKYKISLPLSYKEFLNISGEECPVVKLGRFFKYTDERQILAQELLKEYSLQHLIPKPFLVIATMEGEAFWYFHLDEGDNPAVYRLDCESYGEADDKYTFGKVANSFQDWIEQAIANYEDTKQYKV